MRAFIFPGQGSQKVGMGADLAEASAAARETFQEVDDALNQKLFALMREGPDAELTLTSNAQPAIMANAIAALRVLEKDFGVKLKDAGDCVAGHSLGEYTALCAVNALSLTETAKLLRLRGIAMQDAVPIGVGSMAALLGSDIETAQSLAEAAAEGQDDHLEADLCALVDRGAHLLGLRAAHVHHQRVLGAPRRDRAPGSPSSGRSAAQGHSGYAATVSTSPVAVPPAQIAIKRI